MSASRYRVREIGSREGKGRVSTRDHRDFENRRQAFAFARNVRTRIASQRNTVFSRVPITLHDHVYLVG